MSFVSMNPENFWIPAKHPSRSLWTANDHVCQCSARISLTPVQKPAQFGRAGVRPDSSGRRCGVPAWRGNSVGRRFPPQVWRGVALRGANRRSPPKFRRGSHRPRDEAPQEDRCEKAQRVLMTGSCRSSHSGDHEGAVAARTCQDLDDEVGVQAGVGLAPCLGWSQHVSFGEYGTDP